MEISEKAQVIVSSETPRVSLRASARVMAIGTILSRVTGFGRYLALVYVMGVAGLADAYNLANSIPNIVFELVVGGVLSATLVPVFVRQFTTEEDSVAWRSISAVVTTVLAVLAVTSVALAVCAPWLIDLYTTGSDEFSEQQVEIASFLLRLFAPQLIFYGVISLATGLLHAKRVFGPPMFAPIFNNIMVICVLFALPYVETGFEPENLSIDTGGLVFLGLGTTAGVLAMACLVTPYAMRIARGHLQWVWNPRHPTVSSMLRMSLWAVGFVIANQIALAVSLNLASRGQQGDLTAFLLAYTLFILPHGVFAVSIMSALQPELAERWSVGQIDVFRARMATGMRTILAIMVPAAVGYALLADPVGTVVLNHGRVDAAEAHNAARVLFWMALGLPGFSVFIYLTRVFQAMHDGRIVFYLYVLQNGINVATAFPLYAAMGVTGLALSQTVSYTVAAIVSLVMLRRYTKGVEGRAMSGVLFRIVLATLGMAVVVAGIFELGSGLPIVQLCAGAAAGGAVYIGLARILHISELNLLIRSQRPETNPIEETTNGP